MSLLTAAAILATEGAQEAPNPILPAINEVIWGALAFLVLFVALSKFALPAVQEAMEARTDKIREDLEAAESTRAMAQKELTDYQAQLSDAKGESGRIIEEARADADKLRATLKAQAETEINELKTRAQADIESAKTQAIADLQGQVREIAIGAAEVVVEKNLDADTNTQLVENFINRLNAQAN